MKGIDPTLLCSATGCGCEDSQIDARRESWSRAQTAFVLPKAFFSRRIRIMDIFAIITQRFISVPVGTMVNTVV